MGEAILNIREAVQKEVERAVKLDMAIKDSGKRREFERHKSDRINKNGDARGCYITHGMSKTRIYQIWTDLKRRCYNPKNKRYNRYGGRGIRVCEEWRNDFQSFYDWSMEHGYSENLSIDRIDVDGNYEPSNCRWITMKEQQRNTSRSRFVTANGQTKTVAEWSEITGIRQDVIKDRLNKLHWSEQDSVTIPTMRMGGKRWLL